MLFSDYGKGGADAYRAHDRQARAPPGKSRWLTRRAATTAATPGASVLTPNLAELAEVIGGWSSEAQLLERAQTLRERLQRRTIWY